jgi:hypothetical protein
MPHVEIFTPTGVVSGSAARATVDTDSKGAPSPLHVTQARWYPLDGSPPEHRGSITVLPDELLVVVTPPPALSIPGPWYPIELRLGPYELAGRLPTPPGFDPARALARPTGAFVALRDARIALVGRPNAGMPERSHVQVNRYAVEHVASSLMLGFFFPGAAFSALDDQAGPPTPAVTHEVAPA